MRPHSSSMNPALKSHQRFSSAARHCLGAQSAPRRISPCCFPSLAFPTWALLLRQERQPWVGKVCLFPAALVRCLPGSGMGFSMRKLWSPHLGVAKLCWQTLHLSAAVCQLLWGSIGSLRRSSPWAHRSPCHLWSHHPSTIVTIILTPPAPITLTHWSTSSQQPPAPVPTTPVPQISSTTSLQGTRSCSP